jgi:hypothetical protein
MVKTSLLIFSLLIFIANSLPNDSLFHYENIKNGKISSKTIQSDVIFKEYIVSQFAQKEYNKIQMLILNQFPINDSSHQTNAPLSLKNQLFKLNREVTATIIKNINEIIEDVSDDSGFGYIVDLMDSSLTFARKKDVKYYMPPEYFDGYIPQPGEKVHHNPVIIQHVLVYNQGDVTKLFVDILNADIRKIDKSNKQILRICDKYENSIKNELLKIKSKKTQ